MIVTVAVSLLALITKPSLGLRSVAVKVSVSSERLSFIVLREIVISVSPLAKVTSRDTAV